MITLRHAQPLFERSNWRDMMSVTWLNAGGGEQQAAHWEDGGATTIAVRFARDDLKGLEDTWWEAIVVFNPHDAPVPFTVPGRDGTAQWRAHLNTAALEEAQESVPAGGTITLEARSLVLLA
jgi:glycogen operon protein